MAVDTTESDHEMPQIEQTGTNSAKAHLWQLNALKNYRLFSQGNFTSWEIFVRTFVNYSPIFVLFEGIKYACPDIIW